MITTEHIQTLGLATDCEMNRIREKSFRINEILQEFFATTGIVLVDFKLEFGRSFENPDQIILADEISPDTCRFWDKHSGEKLDKDRFRHNLGDLLEGYNQVLERVASAV